MCHWYRLSTKLKTIEEFSKNLGPSHKDYGSLQRELDDHLGEIKDENSMLNDRVKKLKIVFNGLSVQKESKSKSTYKSSKTVTSVHA